MSMTIIKSLVRCAYGIVGSALRLVAVAGVALSVVVGGFALADYSATQGSGTTFASVVISLKHYMAIVICDATAGESQCSAVNASGSQQVDEITSSQFHTDLTAAVPSLNATLPTTNSYSTGQTNPLNADLNGNLYVHSDGIANKAASTPTVQNAAYASGNCIGGFNAVTVTDTNGQGGYLTNVRITDIDTSAVPTITIYVFDANPSGSTCTDKSTFTLVAADVDKLLGTPVAVTLASPTGTTDTFGEATYSPPRPFRAGGSLTSGVKTIYYALVSGSTFTPATTSSIHVAIGAALN